MAKPPPWATTTNSMVFGPKPSSIANAREKSLEPLSSVYAFARVTTSSGPKATSLARKLAGPSCFTLSRLASSEPSAARQPVACLGLVISPM